MQFARWSAPGYVRGPFFSAGQLLQLLSWISIKNQRSRSLGIVMCYPGRAGRSRGATIVGKSWDVPILFVVTFFRATASCSAICVSKCLSRFCNMSSCCRSVNMAFLGASFLFCAAAPPNQPHIAAVYKGVTDMVGSGGKDVWSSRCSEEAKSGIEDVKFSREGDRQREVLQIGTRRRCRVRG